MKIYDVSSPLYEGMTVYPGDPVFEREEMISGDAVISRLSLSTHTGTHIDAPCHYFKGAKGVDAIHLSQLIGKVEVTKFPNFSGQVKAVFFRDAKNFSKELVEKLISSGINVVGCDVDSVGDTCAHTLLLEKGIVIIENLVLDLVSDGEYSMVALPLKIVDADASPARVVLIDANFDAQNDA